MRADTHDDLGEEALLLGEELVEFAAIFEFWFCVTRKLPNLFHDSLAIGSLGPRLHLPLPRQDLQLPQADFFLDAEILKGRVLFLDPFEIAHLINDETCYNSRALIVRCCFYKSGRGQNMHYLIVSEEYNLSSSTYACKYLEHSQLQIEIGYTRTYLRTETSFGKHITRQKLNQLTFHPLSQDIAQPQK